LTLALSNAGSPFTAGRCCRRLCRLATLLAPCELQMGDIPSQAVQFPPHMQRQVLTGAVVAAASSGTLAITGIAGQDLRLVGWPVEQLLLLQSKLQLHDPGIQLLEALHPLLQPRLPYIAVEGEAEGAQAEHVAGHVQQGYEPDCGTRSLLGGDTAAVADADGRLTGGRGQATSDGN